MDPNMTEPTTEIQQVPMSEIDALQDDVAQLESEWDNRLGKGTFAKDDELANWYLTTLGSLDSMEEQIKAQAAAMCRAIEARRKALAWKWGAVFKQVIDDKLRSQGGKKKSVRLHGGTAGYRTKPESFQVVNDKEALAWAAFNCPQAIAQKLKITPIKEYIKASGDVVPGVKHTPAAEGFFPSVQVRQLPPTDEIRPESEFFDEQ